MVHPSRRAGTAHHHLLKGGHCPPYTSPALDVFLCLKNVVYLSIVIGLVVLGGELAVPYTRNPLMRG